MTVLNHPHRPGVWSVVLGVLATAALVAQTPAVTPEPQQTFRGGVDYIRVDLYASADGGPVVDLRREEVALFEDGVPQQVDTFEHVRIPPGGPEALRVEPNSIEAGRQMAADPRARVFVLFVDRYHMDPQMALQLRTPVRRLLDEALGPADLVAVMTPDMEPTDLTFTRRTTVLAGTLDGTAQWLRLDEVGYRGEPWERMYEECYGAGRGGIADMMIARRREQLALNALEALSSYLGFAREERKTVLLLTKGWELFEESDALMTSPVEGLLGRPDDRTTGRRGPGDRETTSTASLLARCEADRVALARMNHRERAREIAGAANRSNVSFYPFAPLRLESQIRTLSTLRGLAEETDGLAVVNTNNADAGMQRIIADTSSYYLLGYQSTNTRLDGRFRRIRVQVTRPGVQVRARPGYRALSSADVRTTRDASPPPTAPRAAAAVTVALNRVVSGAMPTPMRVRTVAWMRASATGGAGHLWVVGELDPATRREPAWSAGGRGELTVIAPAGSRVGTYPIELPAGAGTFAIAVQTESPLTAGDYVLRVRLVPDRGEPFGDAVQATVPDTPTPLGEPRLLRRGPQTGVQYVDTADIRFRRNERLRLELPTASAESAAARLLDRAGNVVQVPVQVTTRTDAADGHGWIVVDAPVAPLAAGDYLVEVTQEDASQLVGFRVVT